MENTKGLNVVLVHGGWVDGSGWEGVHNILTRNGHHVSAVQIPTLSLADDVLATRRVIGAQDGPVILVGHSYGGTVITEAAMTRRLRDSSMSPHSLLMRVSPLRRSSRIRHPTRLSLRSCRRKTATCSSTERSSPPPSRRTSTQKRLRSWLIRRCHGASRPSAARSANRRGRRSRVGTWSPPKTR